jgi:hypothetical protein
VFRSTVGVTRKQDWEGVEIIAIFFFLFLICISWKHETLYLYGSVVPLLEKKPVYAAGYRHVEGEEGGRFFIIQGSREIEKRS